jgi:hypothetical protein
MLLTIKAFRGDPEKLYLHIKVGKICDPRAVFVEEFLTGIRVIGWRQCDLNREHQQLPLRILLGGLNQDNHSIYSPEIEPFGAIKYRRTRDIRLDVGQASNECRPHSFPNFRANS